jgi:hypothetical protein
MTVLQHSALIGGDARAITRALGGRWCGSYGLARCPAHDDKTPSLSICDGEDELLVKCHAGCDWRDIKDALRQRGLLDSFASNQSRQPIPKRRIREEEDEHKRIELALKLWEPSVPLRGTLAWKYLTERRQLHVGVLDDLSHCLRWNARVGAIIGLMTDAVTGERTGVHRTYLNLRDGTKRGRQMLGRRGVIRLSPDEDVETHLGIVEGIEDGLRILLSGYQPVWVATCADGIKSFPVAPGVESLTVFADSDEAGINAAEACVTRWREQGRAAVIVPPKEYSNA